MYSKLLEKGHDAIRKNFAVKDGLLNYNRKIKLGRERNSAKLLMSEGHNYTFTH